MAFKTVTELNKLRAEHKAKQDEAARVKNEKINAAFHAKIKIEFDNFCEDGKRERSINCFDVIKGVTKASMSHFIQGAYAAYTKSDFCKTLCQELADNGFTDVKFDLEQNKMLFSFSIPDESGGVPADAPSGPDGEVPTDASAKELAFYKLLNEEIPLHEFGVRIGNILERSHLKYVGDLAESSENDLHRIPNLGKKSIVDIKIWLAGKKLHLGMDMKHWRRPIENT